MNKTPKTIGLILLAVFGTALSAAPLPAEDPIGKFTLPVAVCWGQATLPPGDYTIRINLATQPYMAIVIGPSGTVFLNAQAISDRNFSGRSLLDLARRGRTGVVRQMHLAVPGLKPSPGGVNIPVYGRGVLVSNIETRTPDQGGFVLTYAPPKGEPATLARTPELIQRIPVLLASK